MGIARRTVLFLIFLFVLMGNLCITFSKDPTHGTEYVKKNVHSYELENTEEQKSNIYKDLNYKLFDGKDMKKDERYNHDNNVEEKTIHLPPLQCYTNSSFQNVQCKPMQSQKSENDKKKWRKGNGEIINSWLSWMNAIYNEKFGTISNLSNNFNAKYKDAMLYEVVHTGFGVLWRQHGTGACDGFLYGRWKVTSHEKDQGLYDANSQEREFSGGGGYKNSTNVEYVLAYIYQDMKTAIVGEFSKGVLLGGFHRKIVGYKCMEGIMVLKFSKLDQSKKHKQPYRYESLTSTSITSAPKLMDPYEKYYIYINQSAISGMKFSDGIFAKRPIPSGRLIAVYAGVLLNDFEYENIFINATGNRYDDVLKNLIELNDSFTMDVPSHYSNIVDYRSSLAHKVNFKWNVAELNGEFADMNHPRFGSVMCILSIRDIEAGEEIYIDYGYGKEEEDWHPKWYKNILRNINDKEENADLIT